LPARRSEHQQSNILNDFSGVLPPEALLDTGQFMAIVNWREGSANNHDPDRGWPAATQAGPAIGAPARAALAAGGMRL